MIDLQVEAKKIHIVSYLPIEKIGEILYEKNDQIDFAVYIEHNKDECETHIHLYLWLTRSRKLEAIKNWFNIDGVNCLIRKNTYANNTCIDYLLHINQDSLDKCKFRYSLSEIFYFKCKLEDFTFEKKDCSFNILCEVMNGESFFALSKKYGKDFIYHWKLYKELADILLKN